MRIVVVGDALLDVDIDGEARRLSPDAPVPVIEIASRTVRPGGAGLVAALLAQDGADVALVTSVATDPHGRELVAALAGVDVVTAGSGDPTPIKTRVRAQGHAVARLDESCGAPAEIVVDRVMIAAIESADGIVVADYGRGVAGHPAVRSTLKRCAERVPVVWDPHPRGPAPVPGCAVVTPNAAEASALVGEMVDTVPSAVVAAERLRSDWAADGVAVTLGEKGAVLGRAGRLPLVATARAVPSSDPCGAGDRLAATLVRELAAGASLDDAVRSAVSAASAFLSEGGVSSLRLQQGRRAGDEAPHDPTSDGPSLEDPAPDDTVPDNTVPLRTDGAEALAVVRAVRDRGGTVVATGGCFDLLHAGHARTLAAARSLGDCLVVCLNSDASVRRLKGPDRPLIAQDDRVDLLLSLECVDAVLVFDEDTPESALARLEPDLWVKGGDYTAADLPEARLLAERGGRVVTVPYVPARSTSALAHALARVG